MEWIPLKYNLFTLGVALWITMKNNQHGNMLFIYNLFMFDTIAAISTGSINQPISIIRMSGPDSFEVVKKIFSGKMGNDKTITYGYIKDGSIEVDEVLISWFVGPNTFTGENVVEINAHGGVINTNKILELCLTNGARIAERGEFSRRAFLNGKMDLIKAEAIHDMIFAKTENQTKVAVKKFDGKTSDYISNLKAELLKIIATIETNIDYPEYDDVEILTNENLLPKLNNVKNDLDQAIKTSKNSRYISEGVNVAIVGKPNAGKSTLLNALIQEDKAIVTDVPGTTRDIVEGSVVVGGILFHLIDTAGIHSTVDKIEQMGIKKSLDQIKLADFVIHLVDPAMEVDEDDFKISKASENKTYIKVFNKSDISKNEGLSISAMNGEISPLLDEMKSRIPEIDINSDKLITNSRQQSLIRQAATAVDSAINSLKGGFEPDEVIVDVRRAWEDLANITGKADNEKLLDEMFKNFCLGK